MKTTQINSSTIGETMVTALTGWSMMSHLMMDSKFSPQVLSQTKVTNHFFSISKQEALS